MESFLKLIRYAGLLIFVVGILLSIVTFINFIFSLTGVWWLQIYFIRLYLLLLVSGILLYILITFRKKDDEKKE
ncbi:hypothetical protein A1A1_05357 [Planococcus antarcticus DSM 14505]|uniref:Uncharacterized protein n=1 Tax=Planococcus antarcticus DSM 14505 TaxID=1185653 RepID=A0AA87IN32_9BACL|nr:hypothetical protein [Planococcus antarcticus]EIM07611.1 hypothetical protein A1A1_05357 [Planococcus antarcticus DSM 14505]